MMTRIRPPTNHYKVPLEELLKTSKLFSIFICFIRFIDGESDGPGYESCLPFSSPLVVMRIESRTLCKLDKYYTTEPHPNPQEKNFVCTLLGIKLRVSHMLSKHSITELYSQLWISFIYLGQVISTL